MDKQLKAAFDAAIQARTDYERAIARFNQALQNLLNVAHAVAQPPPPVAPKTAPPSGTVQDFGG